MAYRTVEYRNAIADVAQFDSVSDWVEFAKGPASPHMDGYRTKIGSIGAPRKWAGGIDVAGAYRLALEGWPEGRERMVRDVDTIAATADSTARVQGFDVAGAFPDVGRAVTGDPLCMYSPLPDTTAHGKVLTVRFWLSVSANIGPDRIRAWGAGVASQVDALEAAGWRIDLHCVPKVSSNGTSFAAHTVRIKAPDQPLHLDTLAFLASHPAALRRIGFAVYERHPTEKIGRDFGDGYGLPLTPSITPAWVKRALDVDRRAIDIPSAQAAPDDVTPRQAADIVRDILAKGMDADTPDADAD